MDTKYINLSYFVLWPNAYQHRREIISLIESRSTVIRVHRLDRYSINSLIKRVYKYDKVPVIHLKAKTKFLRKLTDAPIYIVICKMPDCHRNLKLSHGILSTESASALKIKTEVRDRFNSVDNPHDHVIHASDNNFQVIDIMHMLDYRVVDINKYLVDRSWWPSFIKRPALIKAAHISMDRLLISLADGSRVKVKNSPHYHSIKTSDQEVYSAYLWKYLGVEIKEFHSSSRFFMLKDNFNIDKMGLIIVRELEDRFLILDGAHRAAINAYYDHDFIKAMVV